MPRISISYRRADSAGITGRIFDRLKQHYGGDSVFIDIDSMRMGRNYKKQIDAALQTTDVLLIVIGKQWLGPRPDGSPRILDVNDPVRLEVEAATRYERLIIPVLVDDAVMPDSAQLPESLAEFPYIQAAEIDSGRFFERDVGGLIRSLDEEFEQENRLQAEHAAKAQAIEQPRLDEEQRPAATEAPARERSRSPAEPQAPASETATLRPPPFFRRALGIMLRPKSTWCLIEREATTYAGILGWYVLPLTFASASAAALSAALVPSRHFRSFALAGDGLWLVGALLWILITGWVAGGLARLFAGRQARAGGLKLTAYSATPVVVARAIEGLIVNPVVLAQPFAATVIEAVAAIYSIVLLAFGIASTVGVPAGKRTAYAIVLVLCMYLVYAIVLRLVAAGAFQIVVH